MRAAVTLMLAVIAQPVLACTGDTPAAHDASVPDAARAACDADAAAPRQPPEVKVSGVHGSLAALSASDRRAFCEWLWGLPDYGAYYCCPGVQRPLRVAVQTESNREHCAADLAIFSKCPDVQVEAYEACAVAKLSRYCGTPLGCDALSNQGQTSICLAR